MSILIVQVNCFLSHLADRNVTTRRLSGPEQLFHTVGCTKDIWLGKSRIVVLSVQVELQ